MSAPRAKPWEVSSGTSTAAASGNGNALDAAGSNASSAQATASTTSMTDPGIPERPESLGGSTLAGSAAGTTSYSPYSSYNTTTSPYSSYGSSYGYNSYGGMNRYGSGMYGGYGSSMYGGGYGGGMYGGYGMGMGGGPMMQGQGGLNSLTASTQATFQLLEGIVGAIGGFAQMLESTYMATHSSFFAMVSVAEQFGNLRNALGSLLGIFAVIRWVKRLIARLTGRKDPGRAKELNADEFRRFEASEAERAAREGGEKQPKPSLKPLLFFVAAVFGFPYLIGRIIKTIAENQERSQAGPGGVPLDDPSKLEFYRAMYDFVAENPQVELSLKKGDLVAIISKADPTGAASQWWRARTKDGRIGYVPSTYLEAIPRALEDVRPVVLPPGSVEPVNVGMKAAETPAAVPTVSAVKQEMPENEKLKVKS